jgi:hypothetical protein
LLTKAQMQARRTQAEAVRLMRDELLARTRCMPDEETRRRAAELEEQLADARGAAKQQHQAAAEARRGGDTRWPLLWRVLLALLLLRALVAPLIEV